MSRFDDPDMLFEEINIELQCFILEMLQAGLANFRLGRMSGRINPNPLFCCPPIGQSAKK